MSWVEVSWKIMEIFFIKAQSAEVFGEFIWERVKYSLECGKFRPNLRRSAFVWGGGRRAHQSTQHLRTHISVGGLDVILASSSGLTIDSVSKQYLQYQIQEGIRQPTGSHRFLRQWKIGWASDFKLADGICVTECTQLLNDNTSYLITIIFLMHHWFCIYHIYFHIYSTHILYARCNATMSTPLVSILRQQDFLKQSWKKKRTDQQQETPFTKKRKYLSYLVFAKASIRLLSGKRQIFFK